MNRGRFLTMINQIGVLGRTIVQLEYYYFDDSFFKELSINTDEYLSFDVEKMQDQHLDLCIDQLKYIARILEEVTGYENLIKKMEDILLGLVANTSTIEGELALKRLYKITDELLELGIRENYDTRKVIEISRQFGFETTVGKE